MCVHAATDNLTRSKSKVIMYVAVPLFVEYLRSNLNPETTSNVVRKVCNTMQRLNKKNNIDSFFSSISHSCNGMREVRRTLAKETKFHGLSTAHLIVQQFLRFFSRMLEGLV